MGNARHRGIYKLLYLLCVYFLNSFVLEFLVVFEAGYFAVLYLCQRRVTHVQVMKTDKGFFSVSCCLFFPESKLCQRTKALKEVWSSYVAVNSLLNLAIPCTVIF